MIDDTKLEAALDWLRSTADEAAKSRATRVYLEEWVPALRAQLAARFIESGDSAAAADMKAKASQEYADALTGLREAVEQDEKMRWHRTRADAVIEVWRSYQANARAQEKIK